MTSAVNGIRGALAHLEASPTGSSRELERASYFGFSFGGIITANLANRTASALRGRRAIFLDDPHDGGFDGLGRARAGRLARRYPVDGEAAVSHGRRGRDLAPDRRTVATCNAVFPRLGHIPKKNKDLVLTYDDAHGDRRSSSSTACARRTRARPTPTTGSSAGRSWDALRSCAYARRDCRFALGTRRKHRSMGKWSDGVADRAVEDPGRGADRAMNERKHMTVTEAAPTRSRWRSPRGSVLYLASATAAVAGGCPTTVDESVFASEAELRKLTAEMAGFGLRSTASRSNEQFIDRLKRHMRRIDGMKIRTERIKLRRWQPLPKADGVPGRDLARAGELKTGPDGWLHPEVPVAGAVPYALPTSKSGSQGPLVYLAPDAAITPENAAGKVVLREFPDRSIPYVGLHAARPLPHARSGRRGREVRPAVSRRAARRAAGRRQAGAAGVIFAFDVPRSRSAATSTRTTAPTTRCRRCSSASTRQLQLAAAGDVSASVVVRAKADGDDAKRHRDAARAERRADRAHGQHGRQHVGAGRRHRRCRRAGTVFRRSADRAASADVRVRVRSGAPPHLAGGHTRYAAQLDEEYDDGTVAFAFVVEHLGRARSSPSPTPTVAGSISSSRAGRPVPGPRATAKHCARPRSRPRSSATSTTPRCSWARSFRCRARFPNLLVRRHRRPFHSHLIPTMAMISGPWSLWAPSFGESAIDFARMRKQLLAAGDAVLGLAALPSAQIAGDYPSLSRAAGRGGADVFARAAAGAGAQSRRVTRGEFCVGPVLRRGGAPHR